MNIMIALAGLVPAAFSAGIPSSDFGTRLESVRRQALLTQAELKGVTKAELERVRQDMARFDARSRDFYFAIGRVRSLARARHPAAGQEARRVTWDLRFLASDSMSSARMIEALADKAEPDASLVELAGQARREAAFFEHEAGQTAGEARFASMELQSMGLGMEGMDLEREAWNVSVNARQCSAAAARLEKRLSDPLEEQVSADAGGRRESGGGRPMPQEELPGQE